MPLQQEEHLLKTNISEKREKTRVDENRRVVEEGRQWVFSQNVQGRGGPAR